MSNEPTRDRVYQVSTNRTSASHKVRYVESSAPPEGECRLCVGTLQERSLSATVDGEDAIKTADDK